MKSSAFMKLIAIGGMALALFAALSLTPGSKPGAVSATANPLPPLLTCPNVDGSTDNKITVADILSVVVHYGHNWPAADYSPLYDLISPYNTTSTPGTGLVTVADILAVVTRFGNFCPLVDTQIAKATRALGDPMFSDILCDPALTTAVNCGGDVQFLTEDATFLHSKEYYEGSSDVPGQGRHYVNLDNWDGVFNPTRPEGLVYTDGRLSAQLYVVDGTSIGWGTHAAGPCDYTFPDPCPGAEHNIDLEGAADGPQCSPACSWGGAYDGWHLHHYLCTVHIGDPSAVAIPGAFAPSIGDTAAHCASFSGGESYCTVPISTGGNGCYTWGKDVGWMGHLWNWLPNANLIPDNGGSNGRFADCYPDAEGWTAYNCPG